MILIWSTYLYSSQLSWNVTHLKQNCRRWYGSYQPISIDAFNQRFWNLSIERRGFSYLLHNVNNIPRLYFFTKWLQNTRLLTVSILVSLSLSLSLSLSPEQAWSQFNILPFVCAQEVIIKDWVSLVSLLLQPGWTIGIIQNVLLSTDQRFKTWTEL